MGAVHVRLELGQVERRDGHLEFSKRTEVQAQVDTGATFSCLPSRILSSCDVVPERTVSLKLADGRQVERKLGHVWMIIEGIRIHTPVLFGVLDDPSLLGLLALEEANLLVDPVSRRFIQGAAYTQY